MFCLQVFFFDHGNMGHSCTVLCMHKESDSRRQTFGTAHEGDLSMNPAREECLANVWQEAPVGHLSGTFHLCALLMRLFTGPREDMHGKSAGLLNVEETV
jgi:hypothetical protein